MKPLKLILIGVTLTAGLTVSAMALSESAVVNASGLNLRAEPDLSAPVYTVVERDSAVVILEDLGDWVQVYVGGQVGYMSAEFLDPTDVVDIEIGTAAITGSDVRMRALPSTEEDILGTYDTGTTMEVVGVEDGWYKVSYDEQIGYVRSDYLELLSGELDGSRHSLPSSEEGLAIVETAMAYEGVPYVYGGTSPSGFDCSGFVYYVFQQHGITLSRTAASQAGDGVAVAKEDLQPGDIVYFSNGGGGSIGHSGIYIGNGQMIHASSGGGRVIVTDLSDAYYTGYYAGARRVI